MCCGLYVRVYVNESVCVCAHVCLCACVRLSKKNQLVRKVVTIARKKRPRCRAGLSDDYNTDKWGFVAKAQGGVGGWKIAKRKHQG